MSSLPVHRGPCVRNPIENGDTSSTGTVGEEGAIGTMRNGNWGLKDRAIIWIIRFQRLKIYDCIFFFPKCGTKDAIFASKIKFLWDVNFQSKSLLMLISSKLYRKVVRDDKSVGKLIN